jgi:hypothetical protein
MNKMKALLEGIERNKGKITKFFIVCAAVKFYISTIYLAYVIKDSKMIETFIDIYSIFIITLIVLHEFVSCIVFNFITENFKMITHNTGRGILLIMISFLYMPPTQALSKQQNYSAVLLFSSGLILILLDIKIKSEDVKSAYELALERSLTSNSKNLKPIGDNHIILDADIMEKKIEASPEIKPNIKSTNPYDIPEDF